MDDEFLRSPELMSVHDTALLVIDVQEKLLPHIFNGELVDTNVGRLLDGAKLAQLPVVCTEQYPQGLGSSVASLRTRLSDETIEKLSFSCVGNGRFRETLSELDRRKVLLCGIETHVCVLQTALDLLTQGFEVFLALDAIGSRSKLDHEVAIRRLESSGITVCTTEAVLFEWCQAAGTELFREMRKLV